jgi:hypothetical protein
VANRFCAGMCGIALARGMQVAFLMADHSRLGAEACGRWRRHVSRYVSLGDVIRLVLEQLQVSKGVIRTGRLLRGDSAMIGEGHLLDPRAVCLSNTPSGDSRIFVADAASRSVKVFESRGDTTGLAAEFTGCDSSDPEWLSEFPGLGCPLALAVTSRGHLVVADGGGEAHWGVIPCAKLVLLDACGIFLREIVSDLRFVRPFTLSCDASDCITLLHRYAAASLELKRI